MMRPLAFAAAVLGFLLVAALVLANFAVWTGTTPGLVGGEFFHPTGEDTVLHDTYYVVASAAQLTMTVEFALLHVLAALFCAAHAPALRGILLAGWSFVGGAALAFAAQAWSAASTWIATQNMPQRYVDYQALQPQLTTQNALALISLVGFLIMLAGWLVLAIATVRRAK